MTFNSQQEILLYRPSAPTQCPAGWLPGYHSSWVKQPGRGADSRRPSTVVPGQLIWDSWWKDSRWLGQAFLRVHRFCPAALPFLHLHDLSHGQCLSTEAHKNYVIEFIALRRDVSLLLYLLPSDTTILHCGYQKCYMFWPFLFTIIRHTIRISYTSVCKWIFGICELTNFTIRRLC